MSNDPTIEELLEYRRATGAITVVDDVNITAPRRPLDTLSAHDLAQLRTIIARVIHSGNHGKRSLYNFSPSFEQQEAFIEAVIDGVVQSAIGGGR